MKKYDIIALGECLIDFLVTSKAGQSVIELAGNPGGAPANVLAAASRLGSTTAFIGKVGSDVFGSFLEESLKKCNIDTSHMIRAKEPTTLAIVSVDERGERSFSFYRDRTADVMLGGSDLPEGIFENTHIFHFGSVSMTTEPSKSATLAAATKARQNGALISFDPNYRPMLWSDAEEAKAQMLEAMEWADLVKVSHEEAEFLTGISEPYNSGAFLMERYSFKLLAVTLADKGCILFAGDKTAYHPGYKVTSIDTTGAGDAFWGSLLTNIIERNSCADSFDDRELAYLAAWANAAGALATTKHGAIPAMPEKQAIVQLLEIN